MKLVNVIDSLNSTISCSIIGVVNANAGPHIFSRRRPNMSAHALFKPAKAAADPPPTSLPPSSQLDVTPDSSPSLSSSAWPGRDTRLLSGLSLPPTASHIGATAQRTAKPPPIRMPMARRSLSQEWSGLSAPAQPPTGAPDDLGDESTTPPAISQREAPWAPRIDSARNVPRRTHCRSASAIDMPIFMDAGGSIPALLNHVELPQPKQS